MVLSDAAGSGAGGLVPLGNQRREVRVPGKLKTGWRCWSWIIRCGGLLLALKANPNPPKEKDTRIRI